MKLFDIAVNASNQQLVEHFDELLSRSLEAGVDKWLMVGTDLEESAAVLALCQRDLSCQHLFCTAGVHPHDAKSVGEGYLDVLKALHQDPRVVALGECGLDFNRDFSPRTVQERVFEQQLNLACELQKPLYLHERDAAVRFSEILKPYIEHIPKAVIHCFTGDKSTLQHYLDMGLYVGITGWVCDERRGTELRDLLRYIPLDRLMLETDAPFLLPRDLSPKPKSRRNEPAYLPHIANEVAQILGLEANVVFKASYRNSCHFFGVKE